MKPFSRFLSCSPPAACALSGAAWADPPGRVGRISHIGGAVFLFNDHYDAQQAAELNWPVTTGDTLTTAAGARAEVRIGSTAIRLDGDSQLEVGALDDQQLRLRLLRGTVAVKVRDSGQARQFTLTTTQGSVALNEAGTYRFEAGRRPDSTAVAVFHGAAAFAGTGLSLGIAAGQQAEIFGESNLGYAITAAVQGEFDAWGLARDRRDDESRSVRYVSREMTGYEDLDAYGDWREVAEYGPVWYPRRIAVGWAPYRSGHWAGCVPGAGRGSMRRRGASRRSTTDAGSWSAASGAGCPARAWCARSMRRPWWRGSAGPAGRSRFPSASGRQSAGSRSGRVKFSSPPTPAARGYVQRINAPHVRNTAHIADAQREPHRAHHVHRSHRDAVTVVPSNVVSSGTAVSRHAYRFAQGQSTQGQSTQGHRRKGQSIDALPAAAAAPALAPPQRRGGRRPPRRANQRCRRNARLPLANHARPSRRALSRKLQSRLPFRQRRRLQRTRMRGAKLRAHAKSSGQRRLCGAWRVLPRPGRRPLPQPRLRVPP
ncbi:MAG: FecR family protein [Rhodocyclaceae bacterium]|nr:FecR family protein [Rhodocyclaceae bacterium]